MAVGVRQEKRPFGIGRTNLGAIEREVKADEPPPLPPNAELSQIGKRVPRIDAVAKVTGAARYTVDIKLPGMLFARLLRSPYPHARVLNIDATRAKAHTGVRAVHLVNASTLSHVGAIVAGVAAVSRAEADEALSLIKVTYEPLPFVVDMNEAQLSDAPPVAELEASEPAGDASRSNVRGPVQGPFGGDRGDVAKGFKDADVIAEGVFETQVQVHSCLEPHAVIADWQPSGLTVYLSTQDVAGCRMEIASAFDLPAEKVRVICDFMGGGFGSKLALGDFALAAIALSREAGAPVSLVLDRHEEQLVGGNRPSTWQKLRVGAKRSGELTAISLVSYGTAGVARGAGVGSVAQGMYRCANFAAQQYDVLINAPPGCAMRAPGNVQGAYALEQLIDELAETLGLDPLALRDRIDANSARREERRIGAEKIGWHRRGNRGSASGPIKRGIGVAQSFWPGIVQASGSCEVIIAPDGSVELRSSVQDIGTGTKTVLAQTVAEELGLPSTSIHVHIGESDFAVGVSSGGSKVTGSMTPAARKAAFQAGQELLARAGAALNISPGELRFGPGGIFRRLDSKPQMSFGEAAGLLSRAIRAKARRDADFEGFRARTPFGGIAHADIGGVQFAEIAVDIETGVVAVERVVAVHDCGRPINPLLVESQIHGGILMGLSYALCEERIIDRETGHVMNADLDHYKIVRACGSPAIDVVLIENYLGQSATDACGVAEPATIATAAAIANAVHDAIGVRIRTLPMNPSRVLAAIRGTLE